MVLTTDETQETCLQQAYELIFLGGLSLRIFFVSSVLEFRGE